MYAGMLRFIDGVVFISQILREIFILKANIENGFKL